MLLPMFRTYLFTQGSCCIDHCSVMLKLIQIAVHCNPFDLWSVEICGKPKIGFPVAPNILGKNKVNWREQDVGLFAALVACNSWGTSCSGCLRLNASLTPKIHPVMPFFDTTVQLTKLGSHQKDSSRWSCQVSCCLLLRIAIVTIHGQPWQYFFVCAWQHGIMGSTTTSEFLCP